jgi:hypothetical protein
MQLRFHLAGINNQNFLMRDEQTGTYWQQITGLAVSGPLAGRRLTLVSADELTFALWRTEQPHGTVLNDVPRYTADYAPENWDVRMAKARTVISYAQAGLKARDVMLGIHASGASRAFPCAAVLKEKLIQDRIGSEPIVLVVGGDNRSVRVFRRSIPGISETPEFYRIADNTNGLMMDAPTGSRWTFQGCAIAGKLKGTCLDQIDVIKDYWFDWRNYNPATTVYGVKQKIH